MGSRGLCPSDTIGCLVFEVSKSKVWKTFDGFLKEANKMYVLYFIKCKNYTSRKN